MSAKILKHNLPVGTNVKRSYTIYVKQIFLSSHGLGHICSGAARSIAMFDFEHIKNEFHHQKRVALLEDFVQTINTDGAVVIKNVGLSDDTIRQAFLWVTNGPQHDIDHRQSLIHSFQSRLLFALDESTKDGFQHPAEPLPHRGHSAVGKERSGGSAFNYKVRNST